MSMKVYLSGDLVYVEKTGQPVLTIPQNRATFTFVGTESSTAGEQPSVFTNVFIQDRLLLTAQNDTLANIRNGSNVAVGDYNAILKYLSGFITAGNSFFLAADSDIATATNQAEQIEGLNTQIENAILADSFSQNIGQNILKELKEITKLLTKIYQ